MSSMGERIAVMERSETLWWAALQQVPGVGAGTMLRLARTFGSAGAAVQAPLSELVARGNLTHEQATALRHIAADLPAIERMLAAWQAQGIEIRSYADTNYPHALKELRTPPPLLYLKGELIPSDTRAMAVIGSRQASREGLAVAGRLAAAFAIRGFTMVSGLARGIDTAGHRGALRTKQGRSLAVLGSGLLSIYPQENTLLAQRITARGCLLAEVPPPTEVAVPLLLARDRIQAALSRAVIVVQSHAACGSIVTATHAVRLGRLLYGVPWTEGPFADGWRKLESMGARPIPAGANLDAIGEEIDAHTPRLRQPPLPAGED